MDNWTPVFESDQSYQAEMVKAILADNDIEAIMLNQKDSAYTFMGTIKVMVCKDDLEKATEIIKTIQL